MSEKSYWQGMDSDVSLKSISIVQEAGNISITFSEDQQGVHTIRKISSPCVKRVTAGFTIIQPSRESVGGSPPVTV